MFGGRLSIGMSWVMFRENIHIPIHNYKPLFVAAMICNILVNTQTHIQTHTNICCSKNVFLLDFHIYCVLCFVSLYYLYFCTVCIVY